MLAPTKKKGLQHFSRAFAGGCAAFLVCTPTNICISLFIYGKNNLLNNEFFFHQTDHYGANDRIVNANDVILKKKNFTYI